MYKDTSELIPLLKVQYFKGIMLEVLSINLKSCPYGILINADALIDGIGHIYLDNIAR